MIDDDLLPSHRPECPHPSGNPALRGNACGVGLPGARCQQHDLSSVAAAAAAAAPSIDRTILVGQSRRLSAGAGATNADEARAGSREAQSHRRAYPRRSAWPGKV